MLQHKNQVLFSGNENPGELCSIAVPKPVKNPPGTAAVTLSADKSNLQFAVPPAALLRTFCAVQAFQSFR